jgi:hypothetical protein
VVASLQNRSVVITADLTTGAVISGDVRDTGGFDFTTAPSGEMPSGFGLSLADLRGKELPYRPEDKICCRCTYGGDHKQRDQ